MRAEAGMQRFTWDMRYPGPWTAAAPQGGAGGPMVPPGKYTVRLTTGGQTQTKPFELKVDPRVPKDGVTQADLEEQTAFLLRVRDAISEARRLQQGIEGAMKKAGVSVVENVDIEPFQKAVLDPVKASYVKDHGSEIIDQILAAGK